ncbi:hypothetical protein [Streptomyces sp. 7N604]|uniref:hypothetical protein n=1 Tax=Streptomyces sp. 7N604 TaxID=3457415 RepID=UPI003FD10FEB
MRAAMFEKFGEEPEVRTVPDPELTAYGSVIGFHEAPAALAAMGTASARSVMVIESHRSA